MWWGSVTCAPRPNRPSATYEASLAAVGGEMDDVVSIVTYVTTPQGLSDIHDVRTKFFPGALSGQHAGAGRRAGRPGPA